MAYTINLTDGSIFATVADGTINTSSSMVLVGKNYAGYGEFLDENFIHLLENGANTIPPGAPLIGQLWWDKSTNTMKVYNGTTFKTISAATASPSQPTSNVVGDLWYNTQTGQLNVFNGSSFTLVGPASTSGQGTSGAVVEEINSAGGPRTVVFLYSGGIRVASISQNTTFTPQVAIAGFATIGPGLQLSTVVTDALFRGTATNSLQLGGIGPAGFLSATTNSTTSGTLGVLNNTGLAVGVNSDFRASVSGADVTLANQTSNGDINFSVNIGGTPTTVMNIDGATGTISGNQINANYADVAERFAADDVYAPGTVVEVGGSAEITKASQDLSDRVFGVISTRAAYLMNSRAGNNDTHPPVAMTGRVPVRAVGTIRKGDRLVSAGNGVARAAEPGEATAFNVIGRSLEDKLTADEGMVEAIVTIK